MVRMFDAGLQEGRPVVVHDRVWTVANGITFLRLLGLPLFIWLMVRPKAYGMAFLVLVIVGTTDWIDGYVARRFDQVTKLGKLIDPLIDRALLATAGLTLAAVGLAPWWVILLILARDLILVGGALLVFKGNPQIPVTRLGKTATACLLIGVPGFLLGAMDWAGAGLFAVVGWIFTAIGLVTYYIAGIIYVTAARQLLGGPTEDATDIPDPGESP